MRFERGKTQANKNTHKNSPDEKQARSGSTSSVDCGVDNAVPALAAIIRLIDVPAFTRCVRTAAVWAEPSAPGAL
ncbi:uncharacterized protein SPSK_05766 [Sporothrix schenckii 1099-18]|uniref:Uncharacterized protein n=1 Tax=Sporothrix schenckii 1099-18 TaxID=1397361 RepID=A0A0F2LTX3_SPOSC|nr:uncharacterized protein SPSK_05766 [Sporothrix schenckii 1099-18]KJR80928.1 hypothetical protein SPSK_05766 [Sporothrix schenckii 1099-18]